MRYVKCLECGKVTAHRTRHVPASGRLLSVCVQCLHATAVPGLIETEVCFCLACKGSTNHAITRNGRELTADCEACGNSWVQYNHKSIDPAALEEG